jgi:hypothetical protein
MCLGHVQSLDIKHVTFCSSDHLKSKHERQVVTCLNDTVSTTKHRMKHTNINSEFVTMYGVFVTLKCHSHIRQNENTMKIMS